MSQQMTCPRCQNHLRITKKRRQQTSFTCPRCLGKIIKPGHGQAAERAITSQPLLETAFTGKPRAETGITAGMPQKVRSSDEDVKGDTKATTWALLLLGYLLIFATGMGSDAWSFCCKVAVPEWYEALSACAPFLAVAGIVAVVIGVAQEYKHEVSCAVSVAALIGAGFAGFVVFFLGCATTGMIAK